MSVEEIPYTLGRLDWVPRVALVDEATATPVQIEVLAAQGLGRTSAFARTLAHDAAVFRERSLLSNASMSGADHEGALPPAEREYAALVESRVTGCRFCAFVHANAAIRLGGDKAAVTAVIDEGLDAELGERYRSITDFAADLAQTPPAVTTERVDELRAAGLAETEIVDLVFAVAQFSWANRTMLPLGETVLPEPAS